MTGRRVYDLTTLADFPGNRNGIPRVIREYISRSYDDPDAVYVVWKHDLGVFREIDPRVLLETIGHGDFFRRNDSRRARTAGRFRYYGAGVLAARERRHWRRPGLARRLTDYREIEYVTPVLLAGDVFVSFQMQWGDSGYIAAVRGMHDAGVRFAQVVYDLLPLVVPQWAGHSTGVIGEYLREVMPVTDLVLAISESTSRDLAGWLTAEGIPVPPTWVFRLGDEFVVTDRDERGNLPEGVGERPFAVCVSTIEGRKNHQLLYYAYRLAERRGVALPDLVVVGKPWYRGTDVHDMMVDDPTVRGRITVLSDLDDDGLAWLYRHCRFTVYPSHYEGWGLPVAESLAWGKPVIAVDSSSIPEIAGDLIDYVDPFSTDELLAAMSRMMDDDYLAAAVERVGRYRPTGWDETYEQMSAALDSLG